MTKSDRNRRSFLARILPALGSLAIVPILGTSLFAGHKSRRYVRRHPRRLSRHFRSRYYSRRSFSSYSYHDRRYFYRSYAPAYYRRAYRRYPFVEVRVRGYGYRGYRPVYGPSPLDLLEY